MAWLHWREVVEEQHLHPGSEAFVAYLQQVDVAVTSSLTRVEMRSLLARRRRMDEIDAALEERLFTAFLADIAAGDLSQHPVDDNHFEFALQLGSRVTRSIRCAAWMPCISALPATFSGRRPRDRIAYGGG